jgi:hypothetical protein
VTTRERTLSEVACVSNPNGFYCSQTAGRISTISAAEPLLPGSWPWDDMFAADEMVCHLDRLKERLCAVRLHWQRPLSAFDVTAQRANAAVLRSVA